MRTVCGKIANIPVESNAVIRRAVCYCSVAGAAHAERWKGTNGEHRPLWQSEVRGQIGSTDGSRRVSASRSLSQFR